MSASSGLIGSAINGIASIFTGNSKANAATSAAQTQANSAQQGINLLGGIMNQGQANSNPFIQGGQSTMAQLLSGFANGTFGTPSSAPVYGGGTFQAPSAADAAATPGYQFTQQQGSKGILQGAAAAGGAISGGTLKALDSFNTGLADSTYGNTFNRSLQTFNAGLQQYQSQLQGYGAQLQGNQQAFNQLFSPTQIGAQTAGQLNNSQATLGADIASEYNNQGNALAAGIIGASNQRAGGTQSGINQALGQNGSNLSPLLGAFGGGVNDGSGVYNGTAGVGGYQAPPLNLGQVGGGGGGITLPPNIVAPPPVGAGPSSWGGLGPG